MVSGAGNRGGRARRRVRGLTLVEMTIILSVVAILTAVLVPTVMSHITQGRLLRARQDVRALAGAIVRFYQDTALVPRTTDSIDGRAGVNVVDMLVTDGGIPALPGNTDDANPWVTGTTDYFSNHLVNNVPGYWLKSAADGLGWNGSYLASTPEADPWGNRYMVNIVFLDPRPGLIDNGEVKRAVFVLSAGPNGIVELPFEQPVTDVTMAGDDIVHRIQ